MGKLSIRFWIFSVLAGVFFLFQNCGEVALVAGSQSSEEVPIDPQSITTSTTTSTSSTSTTVPEEIETFNTETEIDNGACGSFRLQKSYENFIDIDGEQLPFNYIHELIDSSTGQGYVPASPGSISWQGSGLRGPAYRLNYQYYTIDCSLHSIEASFPDKCGRMVSLGTIFTFQGCPAPINNQNPTQTDVIIPENAEGSPLARQGAAATRTYLTGSFIARSVLNLPEAVHEINSLTPTIPLATKWPMRTGYVWTRFLKDKYLALEFHTPTGSDRHGLTVRLNEMPVCFISAAISEFEGDFYIGRDSKNCASVNVNEATFFAETNSTSSFACKLQPGKKYFLNMTANNLRTGVFLGGPQGCQLFWQLDFTKNGSGI